MLTHLGGVFCTYAFLMIAATASGTLIQPAAIQGAAAGRTAHGPSLARTRTDLTI